MSVRKDKGKIVKCHEVNLWDAIGCIHIVYLNNMVRFIQVYFSKF